MTASTEPVPAAEPVALPVGVPDNEDFLTDGRVLVQVMRVRERTIEVEDAKTGEVRRIPLADWPGIWRAVRWRHGVA